MFGHPFGPPFLERETGRSVANQLSQWLRETQVEDHKVLQGLVDYIERLHETPGERRQVRMPDDKEMLPALLQEALRMCYDIWRDVYTKPKGYQPSEFKDRELLRHSKRLLKFAYAYVEVMIAEGERKAWVDQKSQTEAAIGLCESFVGSLAPNNQRTYRHPEAAGWLYLQGQAKRRMSELWMSSARDDETNAKNRSTVHKLPVNTGDATWEQVEKLGFCRKSLCDDRLHQEVYLPIYWSLERGKDDRGRLIDGFKRVRAEVNFAGPDGPSIKFIRRYALKEMAEGDKRWFRIIDNAEPQATWFDDTYKVKVSDEPRHLQHILQSAEASLARKEAHIGNPFDFAQ